MAELHISGMITAGSGFSTGNNGLYCRWRIVDDPSPTSTVDVEDNWHCLQGQASGQTQVSGVEEADGYALWQHPIDVHFATNSVRGWPRLYLEVWRLDEFHRHELESYGFLFVPTASGIFDLDVATVAPEAPKRLERLSEYLIGATSKLSEPSTILRGGNRAGLGTRTCGVVHVELQLLHRGFERGNIQFCPSEMKQGIE